MWLGQRDVSGGDKSPLADHLVGIVVKASASGAEDPELNSRLRRGDFSGSCYTSDLKSGTAVATLTGTWRYRVSAGTIYV